MTEAWVDFLTGAILYSNVKSVDQCGRMVELPVVQDVDGKAVASLRELDLGDLPEAAVTVRVEYSALN